MSVETVPEPCIREVGVTAGDGIRKPIEVEFVCRHFSHELIRRVAGGHRHMGDHFSNAPSVQSDGVSQVASDSDSTRFARFGSGVGLRHLHLPDDGEAPSALLRSKAM